MKTTAHPSWVFHQNRFSLFLLLLTVIAAISLPALSSMASGRLRARPNTDRLIRSSVDQSTSSNRVEITKVFTRLGESQRMNGVAGLNLSVNSSSDAPDSNVGDGHCDTDGNLGNGDQCTLRAAIQEANFAASDDAISFDSNLNGGSITLNSALDVINGNLSIAAPGASLLTIKRSSVLNTPGFRVFTVAAGITVSISGLTVSNGAISGGVSGGGILNQGILTITDCVISNNSASFGGGVCNATGATLNVNSSTVANNLTFGGGSGSGILDNGQSLTIVNSTIANNTLGVAIFIDSGVSTIVNTTISNNIASDSSGGLTVAGPSVNSIANTTITGNRADAGGVSGATGGGISRSSGTINVRNTIVAGNFRGTGSTADDIANSVDSSSSNNLIGSGGSGGLTNGVNHNQVGVSNLGIGALANNGGPTQTHRLLPGSPAIDAGDNCIVNNSCVPAIGFSATDQRGGAFNRSVDGNGDGTATADCGAYEAQSVLQGPAIIVTNTADSGPGSLRQAIIDANANPSPDALFFDQSVTGVIVLSSALPDLSGSITMNAPGAKLLTVKRSTDTGTPTFRIFTAGPGTIATISGLTLSNGKVTGSSFPDGFGGGILNNGGQVTLNAVVVNSSSASAAGGGVDNTGGTMIINNSVVDNNSCAVNGGGISNNGSGNLTVKGSTISNNSGANGAGGLANSGTVIVSNSTISSNNGTGGGGINNVGTLTLGNVTITGNIATNSGGGIFNPGIGGLSFGNTIIAGNTSSSGADLNGANFVSNDYNLIGDTTGAQLSGNTTHTLTNVNARLGPLANHGGLSSTHELLAGSPAIDAGNSLLNIDQRGQPRPIDDQQIANAVGGNASDIGAYEAPTFQVNSTADTDDGACTLSGSGNGCTLREAINAANITSGAELITFAPSLTAGGPITISLLTALPELSSDMTISGPSANLLTIQRSTAGGTPDFRVFTISSGKTVAMSGLTVSNGFMTGFNVRGGGIVNNGSLTMTKCNVYGNSASSGAGIYNDGTSLILTDCNIGGTGPGQPNIGGGLWHSGGVNGVFPNSGVLLMNGGAIAGNVGGGLNINAPATVNGVAITDNTGAGGIFVASNSTTNILNCLIANNATTGSGGGLRSAVSVTNVINTTISGNTANASGGGIDSFNSSNLTLINVTVTNNRASQTGGLVSTGSVLLKNTIISGNFRGAGTTADDTQFLVNSSSANNLIGTCDGCGLTNGVNNNQVGVTNPGLAALADNGGPTKTHAPFVGSPVLDAGNNSFVTNPLFAGPPFTDQRGNGFNRIVDGPDVDTTATVEIGAFEQQVPLAEIADTATNEDSQLIVPFDIGDRSTVTSVTASSSDSTLIPNDTEHLLVTDAGSTEVITINPAANLSGTANITITVNRTGGSASKTFALTVNAVNDAPSFTRGPDPTVLEDAGAQTVLNWANGMSPGPTDEAAQTVAFHVSNNSNPALFSAGPAISSTGTLTYTAAANANGSATISITLKDNGGTANSGFDTSVPQSFLITVTPVNDAPSFTKGANQTVNEDAGPTIVTQWATSLSPGSNEAGQTLSFQVTNNTNSGLFTLGPVISASGMLSFTTTANANGAATLTIVVKDNGGTANGGQDTSGPQTFTITVNAVNDAPTFTKGPDQNVSNNAGTQSVSNWATNLSPGPPDESSQTLGFVVTDNSNPGLFVTAPTVNSIGTLSYAPATNGGGTATITIVLKDNGSLANGGQNTSASQTFNINVTPVGGFMQFSAATFTTTESSGITTVTVKRTGDTSMPVTVDYATGGDSSLPCSTINGAASPRCDFTAAYGTIRFAAGEDTKTFGVLISQDSFVEGSENLPLTLAKATGFAAVGGQQAATLTISDDLTEPSTNPIDEAGNFVRQHYHDFLDREPDQSGLDYWTTQLTQCGNDQNCIRARRIDVSNAFFYELEFQQTGAYVFRLYREAFGNNQPFPNPIPDSTHPGEENKVVAYQAFAPDRARVVGGNDIAQSQLDLAIAFAQRPDFVAKYQAGLDGPGFVDALLGTLLNDLGVNLSDQREPLINLFNQVGGGNAGRGVVLYRLADDNAQGNPINNRAFIDAEYNRAFVATQYFGYLRRDADMAGFLFWLGQVTSAPLRDVPKQHAMVCSFITSAEYQQRFSSLVTHTNAECQ